LHTASTPAPQLSILARISLGPRQSVALVEAEGVRLLVGTSADGPPSFYPLAGCSGVNPDRDSDRAASAMQESESSHGDARDRMPAGSVAIGSNGGARTTSRMRLTGRVSWV
jgi:flagellar biogenesis protein FliO